MLTFDFLDARHGDSFLVRWGTRGGRERVMLVDGGPGGVYEAVLRERLTRLAPDTAGAPRIDAVCLSHVDDDHTAGLLRLLGEIRRARRDDLPEPFAVRRLWFNSVEELVDHASPGLSASVRPLVDRAAADSEAVKASYNQGRAVRDEAVALGLDGNPLFDGPLIEGTVATLDRLRVTVVAPDDEALDELAERWREAKRRKDPDVIRASYSDGSIPNLSSIVLLIEHEGRTALLTGDARGDRILAGLRATGLLTGSGPLHVDLLKLPHHGSDRNVESDFFEQVHADHYVISADGIKHHHPGEDTLRMLVGSRDPEDTYTVHLTNRIPFATEALKSLHTHRGFAVHVRAPREPALVIEAGDLP
ncbi:ComEC/Rec2 family competence protein [Streptomyces sp. GC420]|uniref:ComEC/Rec2 family competence protein n=1 Tax=Streptomyces sp. GC420 TaxID=2697568 RepID=UPI001414F8EB|nr:MBL fold metallo-hydrolase [Streptomyces sp. GC420]NBM21113.1 MBL fold metallo-hydrolase [Streptomyces sp. GC420]